MYHLHSSPRPARALIIGAGPAGLTAAYELLKHTNIQPVVIESTERIGGISCTVNHEGNRIDIGGHRFFSKSGRVMEWWMDLLPLEEGAEGKLSLRYQGAWREWTSKVSGPNPLEEDEVMLLRQRKSRIYHRGKFYAYPLRIDLRTMWNLGLFRLIPMAISYLKAHIWPRLPEQSLADFMVNRFGKELYKTFFKSYTEKVWGVPCEEIDAAWGHQRVKGLSIKAALLHAWRQFWPWARLSSDHPETSLIEHFLYPKFGPGQLWEVVARKIVEMGGEIHFNQRVDQIEIDGQYVLSIRTQNLKEGTTQHWHGDHVISTMPISNLVSSIRRPEPIPATIHRIAEGLCYRDFFTVGVLLKSLKIVGDDGQEATDNWIYIQEPEVKLGRLQLFHNWSPWMVAQPGTYWLGAEYFCDLDGELGQKSDQELQDLCVAELVQLGFIDQAEVLDTVVIRMPKAYPAYFGTYEELPHLTEWLGQFHNLYPVGRNGMHRYNNQDHSMLAAMEAVELIRQDRAQEKHRIWRINTEKDYHEVRTASSKVAKGTPKPSSYAYSDDAYA